MKRPLFGFFVQCVFSAPRTVFSAVELILFSSVLETIIVSGTTFSTLECHEYFVAFRFLGHRVTSSVFLFIYNINNGGKGWVRTTVGVPPADLQSAPFDHSGTLPPLTVWSQRRDSNPQPADYKSAALPVELRWLDTRFLL
ncbi:MAG: hypothetical protein PWQ27_947 [Kosmotoga sp.]|nr:hypothetical protein [Kosmotoga sp.]MDK2953564.1 hypothetical protein [Kosmotoga sp.]